MTGALVPTGELTLCCGDHHPAEGEASACLCCPECVTNAEMGRHDPGARRLAAQWVRFERACWQERVWQVARALGLEEHWRLCRGSLLAVRVLPLEYPPVQGRLT